MPKSKESIIADALGTQEGMTALAEAMVAPIKAAMNYQSIGRKIFHVEPLEGPAYYDTSYKTSYVGPTFTPTTIHEMEEKMVVAVDINNIFGLPGKPDGNRRWARMKHGPCYYPGDGSRWGDLI